MSIADEETPLLTVKATDFGRADHLVTLVGSSIFNTTTHSIYCHFRSQTLVGPERLLTTRNSRTFERSLVGRPLSFPQNTARAMGWTKLMGCKVRVSQHMFKFMIDNQPTIYIVRNSMRNRPTCLLSFLLVAVVGRFTVHRAHTYVSACSW